MPSQSGTEDIVVSRIAGHGEILIALFHEQMIEMLIMRKEAQSDGAYVEIGVHTHPWIIAGFDLLLCSEHTGSGTEDRRMIAREIPQVDTDLCLHGMFEPPSVVIEPML